MFRINSGFIFSIEVISKKGVATDLSSLKKLSLEIREKKILVYCDAASCALSKLLALHISTNFKIPVYELEGGIAEWEIIKDE